eukprot:CAMPEP_0170189268 /NCGR_PEP_ID=MMETSP0040_2-20121228/46412_1 /TAXON_ID=641309 /ORGANISM="Lotharella oceanica, Strain CCMP622" /LENGTH=74 /DNA_ID=CAMNT_0010436789 /DNA_START=601 /DNA_END=825 /DNA_ORIENTATION=+
MPRYSAVTPSSFTIVTSASPTPRYAVAAPPSNCIAIRARTVSRGYVQATAVRPAQDPETTLRAAPGSRSLKASL